MKKVLRCSAAVCAAPLLLPLLPAVGLAWLFYFATDESIHCGGEPRRAPNGFASHRRSGLAPEPALAAWNSTKA